jgi:hypothetical protein
MLPKQYEHPAKVAPITTIAVINLFRSNRNDSGVVAFSTGSEIFTGNGGPLTTLVDTQDDPLTFTGVEPGFNNSGTVAFRGSKPQDGAPGLFVVSDGTLTEVVSSDGEFDHFFEPAINNSGVIAFKASLDSGGQGIFVLDGASIQTVAETGITFSGFFLPAINDSGTVVFWASLTSGGAGIFAAAGGQITMIAVTKDADANSPFLIGVGKGSRPPRPPNRACGSPAHGSPVDGFLIGIDSPERRLHSW